jgi:thiol-disulfide isomerase/thioredoxin
MRIKRSTFCLLTVLCTLAGCSQTGGVRPGGPSGMKTVASVGDKPVPIVAGEPGSSVRAENDELDLPETSGSRISGRVFDDHGKPVPNARVRLADTSSPGGKVVYATTERSGAFTLKGLRAGVSYVVIAEYQGEDGVMTGRTQAKAPQTSVRIALQPRDRESSKGHASIRAAKPIVEPISNIDPVDNEPSDETRPADKVNTEDIDLPADDAASLPPRKNVRLSRASDDVPSSTVRAGWNSRPQSSPSAATTKARSGDSSDDGVAASRSAAPAEPPSELDDDGPNPLPPALDTAAVSSGRSAVPPEDDTIRVAQNTPKSSGKTKRRTASASSDRDDRAIGIMEAPGEREPGAMPEEILPGARVITPGSSAPIVVIEPPDLDSPPASRSKNSRRSASPTSTTGRSTKPPADTESPGPADSSDTGGASSEPARPTWRELSHNQSKVPLDESIRRASNDAQPGDSGVVTLTGTTSAAKPARPRLLGGSRPPVDEAVMKTVCRFDPSERRLVDFQLPGLDGKTTSLRDIDADIILLDFWGSWCAPCRTSIPHLIELQAKLGGKRLQVVGIACEKGASLQDRRASAGKAIHDLGISYPVLLSSKDGSCPVQQALQIQFYPTMVLIDRDGRLLAREQGATEATLSRMDRAIASALK